LGSSVWNFIVNIVMGAPSIGHWRGRRRADCPKVRTIQFLGRQRIERRRPRIAASSANLVMSISAKLRALLQLRC
jgi:hypothetical protein